MSRATPFPQALAAAKARSGSALCIGLDPDPELLPEGLTGLSGMRTLLRQAVESTADLACAYKPNLAFFERFGSEGWQILEELCALIPPEIPVIADAKRGDIGSTTTAYADALYVRLGAAACTANPFLGTDALAPLLEHPDGFAFILCRTSNPGAAALQDLVADGRPLYAHVMQLFQPWLATGKAGLVIGAQEAAAFHSAADLAPTCPILVPGIGAQGGTTQTLAAALSPSQREMVVVSASRSILHAGRTRNYVVALRQAAETLHAALRNDLRLDPEGNGDGSH